MNGRYDILRKRHPCRPALSNNWAFTLKARCRADCTMEYYRTIQNTWSLSVQVLNWSYECDKLGRLHVHGIIKIHSQFDLNILKSRHIVTHFKRLRTTRDYKDWTDYCHKDQDILEDFHTQDETSPPKQSMFR